MDKNISTEIKEVLMALGYCYLVPLFVVFPLYYLRALLFCNKTFTGVSGELLMMLLGMIPYMICYFLVGLPVPYLFDRATKKYGLFIALVLTISTFSSRKITGVSGEFSLHYFLVLFEPIVILPACYFGVVVSKMFRNKGAV